MDEYTAGVMRLMTAAFPDLGGAVTDAAEARRLYDAARFPSGPRLRRVEERLVPGRPAVPVRVYRPDTDRTGLPVVVFFHGGGFVLCGLDSHDAACRVIAEGACAIVVAVDYRLAPEHPFPAAVDDAATVLRWVHEHATALGGDPSAIAVAGDSAGGNLATVSCLRARDQGGPPIVFQLLIYPVTDCLAPRIEHADGFLLTSAHMRWFVEQYLRRSSDGEHPYASPLRAPDLSGLPPAMVLLVEHDPLRTEGEAYALRLAEAGVPVTTHRVDGLFHGTFGLGSLLPLARDAERAACEALTEVFGHSRSDIPFVRS